MKDFIFCVFFVLTLTGCPGNPLGDSSKVDLNYGEDSKKIIQISDINDQSVIEDSPIVAAFTINVDDFPNITCSGSVSGSSSNTAVIANAGILVSGTVPNCTATITPVANANGTSTITLSVSDGSATGGDTFLATISAVNDAPIISDIADQTMIEDTAAGIVFTTSDIDSALTCSGSVSGSSSNTAVIANGGINITGTVPNCTVTLTPVANASGVSTITMTVSDGVTTSVDTFLATVSARPDLLSVIEPADGVYGLGSSIIFEVGYDTSSVVTGVPRIPLTVGASTVYANYSSGSGSQNLFFTYIVGAGENDSNGILANSTIDLNGGTIAGSGNNFPLDLTSFLGSLANVNVNTTLAAPGQVSSLTQTDLSANRMQASFSWGVPSPGGAAISEYRVRYRVVGTVDFTMVSPSPTTNSVTLSGLTTEVNYEVQVAAFNGVIGPYSSLLGFSTIFTPKSLNALIWYEAKDINGTGVVPADGVSISTLVDKSGTGNNASLLAGETAGVIQTTSGQKVLRVSNATYRTLASLGEVVNTDLEVYLVAKVNSISNSFAFVNDNQANSNRYGAHFPWSDGKAYIDLPMTNRLSNPWGGNTSDIFAWTFRSSTTQGRVLERNGVSIVSGGNKSNTAALKRWNLFGNLSGTENWNADFVAIFVFNKVLTPTQRQEFFNYVETNYGVVMP